jgi:protein associated with RNAse G/E
MATPARWDGDTVHIVDLDLDVVRRRATGAVELLDEHEFAAHRELFGYPDAVVAQAQAAAATLFVQLGDGTEPFATAYRKWLALVL